MFSENISIVSRKLEESLKQETTKATDLDKKLRRLEIDQATMQRKNKHLEEEIKMKTYVTIFKLMVFLLINFDILGKITQATQ